jgi:MFS transporter (putative signal transducer)
MFLYSTFFVAVTTVAMDWSSLAQAGTDYTIMQCTMHMIGILAMVAGGFLAGAMGWTAYFALAALLALGGVGLAFLLFPGIQAEVAAP